MPVSFANVQSSQMELTPCRVTYKGVDLGGTTGNVVVTIDYSKSPIKADQLGDTNLDMRVSGMKITVVTELAEYRLKDNWKVVWPNAKLATSGPDQAVYFESRIGEADLDLSGELLLHPLSLVDADLSGDVLFYLATAEAKSTVTFSPTEQNKLKLTWNIYPDTGVVPARFLIHGDPSVGLVAATAGAPVFSGTGNGTVTSVVVYSGFTQTENIVINCVGQTTGNDFTVVGSLSGPLGSFHIAAAAASTHNFVSDQISFTMTQGSTQFVFGDDFTIATVAANYA